METYFDYLRATAPELGERIIQTYPALQSPRDPLAPALSSLLRDPLPAQALVICGVAKYLKKARAARIVGECGTGKTLMSMGVMQVHAAGRPYTALVMVPPHIVAKWAREALLTVPNARAFFVEDLRNGGDPANAHGIVEVMLEKGQTVVRGLKTSLPELRRLGPKGWKALCPGPAFFIMGKEKGKLGYFWKHAFVVSRSGRNKGGLINPDTGAAVPHEAGGFVSTLDLEDKKFAETGKAGKDGTERFSPIWQADSTRIQRMAPLDFIGRYMKGWWDYAVADELHQLAGDTAQGNGLGVLARCAGKLIALTGTLMGGYADDLFNIFYRMEPRVMVREGFEAGSQGRRDFQQQYGVLETVEKVRASDNACSKASKRTVQVVRKPGASPLLFGKYLMESTAFISLEDISDHLPSYDETVLPVEMGDTLGKAYTAIQEDMKKAMEGNRGNKSLMSVMLNTLLLYPDHPFGIDPVWAKRFDEREKRMVPFLVTVPEQLSEDTLHPKEERLLEDIRQELREGRRCQVYATFTGKHDVTARLERVLMQAGFRVAVLRSTVPTAKREAWYDRQVRAGVEVVVCHPKLVETGLDLLAFPTLYYYETGYSLHTLRQASRRSWRIGQHLGVRVKFFAYAATMQEVCLRHMGKKMLVALMMEGKFSGEGLQSLDANEDLLSAMARELVEKGGVGESADAVWKQLDKERGKHLSPSLVTGDLAPTGPVVLEQGEGTGTEELALPLEQTAIVVETVASEPVPTENSAQVAAPAVAVTSGLKLIHSGKVGSKRKVVALWPVGANAGEQMRLFG